MVLYKIFLYCSLTVFWSGVLVRILAFVDIFLVDLERRSEDDLFLLGVVHIEDVFALERDLAIVFVGTAEQRYIDGEEGETREAGNEPARELHIGIVVHGIAMAISMAHDINKF